MTVIRLTNVRAPLGTVEERPGVVASMTADMIVPYEVKNMEKEVLMYAHSEKWDTIDKAYQAYVKKIFRTVFKLDKAMELEPMFDALDAIVMRETRGTQLYCMLVHEELMWVKLPCDIEGNFFHFKKPTFQDIYKFSKLYSSE